MSTKIYILFISLVCLLSGCRLHKKIIDIDQSESILKDLSTLASDDMAGREIGKKGETLAARFIAQRFKNNGLTPIGAKGYVHLFSIQQKSDPHAENAAPDDPVIEGKNVIGFKDNGQKNTIVIGAHYDHLGMGHFGSLHTGPHEIHNGADDNASGVAAIIALSERLVQYESSYNYLFIAFSGEEKGLWGSKKFTESNLFKSLHIACMFNLDMVGRLKTDKKLAVYGTGTAPIWDKALKKNNKFKFEILKHESGLGPSDHSSFYLKEIPVLNFFTGQHSDYHKPSDDVDKINFPGLESIIDYIEYLIVDLDDVDHIQFQKTKDQSMTSTNFRVTLGVLPDYTYTGKGMRIDGVRDNRPAHKADIQGGDVVVQMGPINVVDMTSYMKALSAFDPGETIRVIVKRDGKEIIKQVTFDKSK